MESLKKSDEVYDQIKSEFEWKIEDASCFGITLMQLHPLVFHLRKTVSCNY